MFFLQLYGIALFLLFLSWDFGDVLHFYFNVFWEFSPALSGRSAFQQWTDSLKVHQLLHIYFWIFLHFSWNFYRDYSSSCKMFVLICYSKSKIFLWWEYMGFWANKNAVDLNLISFAKYCNLTSFLYREKYRTPLCDWTTNYLEHNLVK